jgi:3',5'-cyclic AMP phosphodiesterase CpdA
MFSPSDQETDWLIKAMVTKHHPDMIVITGDLTIQG